MSNRSAAWTAKWSVDYLVITSFFLYGFALSSILSIGNGTVRFTNVIFTIEQTKENVCACDKPIDFHKFVSFDAAN